MALHGVLHSEIHVQNHTLCDVPLHLLVLKQVNLSAYFKIGVTFLLVDWINLDTLQSSSYSPIGHSRCNNPGYRTSKEVRQRHIKHGKNTQNLSAKERSQLC